MNESTELYNILNSSHKIYYITKIYTILEVWIKNIQNEKITHSLEL